MHLTIVTRLSILATMPLASVSIAAQTVHADSSLATVSGTVYDSLDGHPLAGALVQMVTRGNTAGMRSVRTDSLGDFHLTAVPPGEYLIGFWHVMLDSLGLDVPPRALSIEAAAPLRIALGIPSASAIHATLCPSAEPGDSSGLLLGFVRDADTGGRLAGGVVDLSWMELVANKRGIHSVRHDVSSKVDQAGWYAQCGLSSAGPIAAHATVHDNESGIIDIAIPPHGVLRRDFSVPVGAAAIAGAGRNADVSDSSAQPGGPVRHGSAGLAGRVLDEHGKPLSGAQIIVWGSGIVTVTGDDGTFTLSGLAAGTQTVETHYLGYTPAEKVVDLTSGRVVSVTVTLNDRVNLLSAVTVYGKHKGPLKGLAGFLERRALGFGRFITQADIAKQRPARFTDILQGIPEIKVIPTGNIHYTLVSTSGSALGGPCHPEVYINGTRLVNVDDLDQFLEPADVVGVEIYNGLSDTPAEFQGKGLCGTVVIWTSPHTDTALR
jgi:hypothetical protein